MEASHLVLPPVQAVARLPIKQHGFQVKGELGPDHHSFFLDLAAPSCKREVGFKGLLDVAARGSLPPPSSAGWGYPVVGHVEVVGTAHSTPAVRRLVKSVVQGMRACQDPEASSEGLGGTYFFMNEQGEKVAIMKPCDEEPLAPNNPKGFVGRALGDPGLKPTVRVGEAAMREVAAYLLDHDHFANVPCTVLVRLTHPIFHVAPETPSSTSAMPMAHSADSNVSSTTGSLPSALLNQGSASNPQQQGPAKLGSLQEFVHHCGDTSEQGASRFSTHHVHRIGILDLRLLNTDRHAGNMLCELPSPGEPATSNLVRFDSGKLALVPIDHGFCLPEALEPPFFEWLHWPQAMIPFSEEELAYIAKLDPEADCELLRRELPWLRDECLRTLTIATTFLKAGAAAGLSLSEIGNVISRPLVGIDEEPSELEKMCAAAHAEVVLMQAVPRDVVGARWSSLDSDDEWDGAGHGSDADTGTPHILQDVQEDEMLFDLDEDSPVADPSQLPAPPWRTNSMLGMPLHSGAPSTAKQLPISSVSPSSVSPTSPQHITARPGYPMGEQQGPAHPSLSRRSTSSRSHASSSNAGASTIGPRGSAGSLGSREVSLDLATIQGQLAGKQSLEDGASSPEGGMAQPPQSLASGMWMRPGGRGARQRVSRRRAAGAAGCKPPALGMGGGMGGAAYPPPVEGAIPGGSSDPLAGLTAQDWPLFMAALQAGIDLALREGRWRAAPPTAMRGGLLASCPRF